MYIAEVDSQERESTATRLLIDAFSEQVLATFGLGQLAWMIVEASKPKFCSEPAGDIDILAGPLEFRDHNDYNAALEEVGTKYPEFHASLESYLAAKTVAEAGGLKWPPEPSFAVGIEVKCAIFVNELRSAKSSDRKVSGIRKQIEWLERMGLDYVGLVDIVGTEPAYQEHDGFFGALHRSEQGFQAMESVLANRLPEDSAAAHLVWPIGAVGGGDEGIRGAGGPVLLREPRANPRLDAHDPEALNHRRSLVNSVTRLLSRVPTPRYFPVAFLDCRRCRDIHYLDDPACPLSRNPGRFTP